MKKALVLSDSHGSLENVHLIMEKFQDIHTVFHLGDLVEDANEIKKNYRNVAVELVRGNNDYKNVPHEKEVLFCGKKVLLTHGHRQRVNTGILSLNLWAKEKNADIVLFGHTHKPFLDKGAGIVLFNPGSISLPRGSNRPNFGKLEINDEGNICAEIFAIDSMKNINKIFENIY